MTLQHPPCSHPLRIAIIAPSAPPVNSGGVASAHYNLFRSLAKRGYQTKLFTFGDHSLKSSSGDIVRHGANRLVVNTIKAVCHGYYRLRYAKQYHYQVSDILSSFPGSAKINKDLFSYQPHIIILPDQGSPGLFIRKPSRCRMIVISHHNPLRFINQPLIGDHCEADARTAVKLENHVLRKADAIVCPSRYMQEMFLKTYRSFPEIQVIPNMFDDSLLHSLPQVDVRSMIGLEAGAVVIHIPSAGSRFKGSRYVFEIVRRLTRKHGRPIGFYLSGIMSTSLKYELGLAPSNARIYTPGQLSYEENLAIVKSCSFTVSPTLLENFGMALLESISCGVPVVTFAVGGNEDIVIDKMNGFIAPYLDIEGLIASAEKLLDNDSRRSLTTNCIQSSRKFTGDHVLDQYEALIQKLVRPY